MSGSEAVHILYLGDPQLAGLVQASLHKAGYLADVTRDEEAAMAAGCEVWVVALPAPQVLDVIRRQARQAASPFTIILVNSGHEAVAAEVLRLGASDYIIRDGENGFLQVLPGVVGKVLEQKRLVEETARLTQVLQESEARYKLLNRASQEFGSTLDLNHVLDTVLSEVRHLLDIIAATVWLIDPQTGDLVCRHNIGPHHEILRGWHVKPGVGLVGWVAQHGQSLMVPDTRADERHFKNVDQHTGLELRSILGVPLRVKQAVIGVLQVVDTQVNRFDAADLTLLESLAASAAIAIENARLYEQARHEITMREQAQLELQARNEELDAFARTVAHDLKGVVGRIMGYAMVLEEDHQRIPAQELQGYLGTIGRDARKMNNVIDALLVLAGVRKMDAQVGPIDMESIVDEALQRLRDLIQQDQAEIILPEAGTWPLAVGYSPWIEEVWVNYLSNAIKYGGRPPRLEIGVDQAADQWVRFWVRDNGLGIKAEEQDRLFLPFTQLGQVDIAGHGLGLSIVQRIVDKLGGQVGVESNGAPGEGSTFFFTLPAWTFEQPGED
ncbi:MAG: GAF domain-containing protein [Thermoflexales bacterium]|nr:GAF domain-containing protein [Thermoflexales bacterium]